MRLDDADQRIVVQSPLLRRLQLNALAQCAVGAEAVASRLLWVCLAAQVQVAACRMSHGVTWCHLTTYYLLLLTRGSVTSWVLSHLLLIIHYYFLLEIVTAWVLPHLLLTTYSLLLLTRGSVTSWVLPLSVVSSK